VEKVSSLLREPRYEAVRRRRRLADDVEERKFASKNL